MKKNSVLYTALLTAVLGGVVYLSLPSERTLVEMSRDDINPERTEQLLKRRFEREPDNVDAALELVDFLDGHGRFEDSFGVLEALYARHPDADAVRKRYGLGLLRKGDGEAALSVVPEALRTREFYLAAAQEYEKRGDLSHAEAMLLKAGDGLPDDPGVWKRIARWRWDMYEMDAAADALRRALRLVPDDADALEAYYTNRVWQLDAAEAMRIAGVLEKIKPLDRMHLNALYGLQMSVRDIDGAAGTLEKITRLPDSRPEDAFLLGVFLYQKGDVAGSDRVFWELASTPGLSRPFLNDSVSRLEASARQRRDLELAERLIRFVDVPELAASVRIAAVDIAMELGRFDVAAKHIAPALADPGAPADVLEAGLELAYRMDDYAALPGLHGRMQRAGVSIDALSASLPQDDKPLAEWRAASAVRPGRAYAMAGWLKTALRMRAEAATAPSGTPETVSDAEIADMADRLLPLVDERAVIIAAAGAEALAYLAERLPDAGERRLAFERAAALIGRIEDSILADSVSLMLLAAGANSAIGRPEAAWEALEKVEARLDASADSEQRLQLAWQFLAAAAAAPANSPEGKRMRAGAAAHAESLLNARWDDNLSQSLFWLAIETGDLERAKAHADGRGNAPEIHAALAEAFLEAGRNDEALAEASLGVESGDRAVLLRMAHVLSRLERTPEAKDLLARVERAGGEETPEYLLQLADAYGAVGEYQRQYELAEKRARAGGVPEWLDAVDRRTWSGDSEGGLALLAEARESHPRSPELADRTITLLVDLNRPGEAVSAFARAGRDIDGLEERLSADALAALGASYDDLRSAPRARRFFRLSLGKNPVNKRGLLGFARLLGRDGDQAGAILQLRRYVEGMPDDAWGWLELANARAAANQVSRSDYREVVRLTEPDAGGNIARDVRAARAVALRALGREREALALLQDTVGGKIDNPDIACDYVQMLMDIGRYDEAEGILRETIAAFPYHVWAYRLEA
ncbi:MAG: hypothetical protein LBS30_03465, partial [Planctomycetota bacterium]|nr:hypothetical protein [Planctomycetota bacterium]